MGEWIDIYRWEKFWYVCARFTFFVFFFLGTTNINRPIENNYWFDIYNENMTEANDDDDDDEHDVRRVVAVAAMNEWMNEITNVIVFLVSDSFINHIWVMCVCNTRNGSEQVKKKMDETYISKRKLSQR